MPCMSITNLDRAKDPQDERLHNDKRCRANAKAKVDANVLANLRVAAILAIHLGPVLEPDTAACN